MSILHTMPPVETAPVAPTASAAPFASAAPETIKPMRVVFLTHYFPPEGNAPASRVYEVCKRWVAAGHSVTVITGAPNAPDGVVYPGYRNRLWARETIDGIDVLRVWTHIAANKGTLRRIINFLTFMCSATIAGLFVKKPDVLIATSPQFFCGIAGGVLRCLRRVRFILEVRDIWPESIAAVGAMRARLALRVLEAMERWMYRRAQRIVTVGDGYKQQLIARDVHAEKIDVITNGVDTELFTPRAADPAIRQRHGLGDRFIVGYIGTIGMASGLDVVLRAGALLRDKGRRDIVLMLVGDGAVRESLQQQASALGLDNVVFTGRRDKSEMPAYLATVDACLIHLKRQDLFKTVLPSKIFEAGGMRRPIILGVEGCAADLVTAASAGLLITPEDEAQLVAAAEKLADDRALGRRMGDSGHDYIVRHFNRDTLAGDYLRVLARTVPATHHHTP